MRDSPMASWRIGIGLLTALLIFGAAVARAQQVTLRGFVTDSAGAPITDADVGIVALRRLTRTNEHGRFVFTKLPSGEIELSIRRLSYEPLKVLVLVAANTADTVLVQLTMNPATLSSVNVTARQERQRQGIEDFHRRRINGMGTYVTREEILARGTIRMSDVLRTSPGLRFVRLRGGGMGLRFNSSAVVRRDCAPLLWIDGQRAPGMEIDDVPATDAEGIELYSGPSTTPLQFSQASSASGCGAVVIWTRNPGS